MKILCTGDWHLRFQKPQSRTDANYFETQYGKVKNLLEFAEENKVSVILQPGDFFDSSEVAYVVINYYIKLFKWFDIPIFCVAGQHDKRFHTKSLNNTPLGVLEASKVVKILNPVKPEIIGGVAFYGLSWGEEKSIQFSKHDISILILHKMVVTEKLWFGQEDYVHAHSLFAQFPEVDLFVCGDNHKSFTVQGDARRGRVGRYVVNCGSLMRSGIDQVEHRPVAYVYDTDTRALRPHFLDVAPAAEVLDVERAREADARDAELRAFVDGLGAERDLGLGFLENLRAAVTGVDEGVRGVVEEALGRVVK